MGYPQQPQDPYGQSGPQYGPQQYPPQQPYGYGYQPPTMPPPPPPKRNIGVILLLAIGLPLLLLGGCAAVVIVFSNSGQDRVVVQPDAPVAKQPVPETAATEAPPAVQETQEAQETVEAEQRDTAQIRAENLGGDIEMRKLLMSSKS